MLTRRTFISTLIAIPILSTIVRSEPPVQEHQDLYFHGHGDTTEHWSDCATHNEPAYPNGECDCQPPEGANIGFYERGSDRPVGFGKMTPTGKNHGAILEHMTGSHGHFAAPLRGV